MTKTPLTTPRQQSH